MTAASGQEPTITAISTPPGVGGIGIIRISGELAHDILNRIFTPGKPNDGFQSHRFYHGWIVDPASRKKIDEVLAVFMRAPDTYTREDVVEIHCHSNYLILQKILSLVLAQGAKPASAGEFTKRAFLNGRIDLTQAEAVIELLNARTRKGLDLAVNQLHGQLQDSVLKIRSSLVSLKATLEVAIDFPEEDAEIMNQGSMNRILQDEVIAPLSNLLKSAETGKIFREGISVVIIGRPNVGKSSLLNALLEEERAIVTAVPGTTRDLIEEYLDIHGMPVRLVDTAGIRNSSETVEEIGIQRARKKIESADLILLVIDVSQPLTEEDYALRETIGARTTLLVGNKIDIAPGFAPESLPQSFSSLPAVSLSAKDLTNIGSLKDLIFNTITGGSQLQETDGCVPNIRHRDALRCTLSACRFIEQGMAQGIPSDLLAVDLQAALDHLGDIVGQTTPEEVLDWIFEQFCIGK